MRNSNTAYVLSVNLQGRAVFFRWRDADGVVKDGAFYRHSDGRWGASPEFLAESPASRRHICRYVQRWQQRKRESD
ncbi:MAG: hypothetical protein ACI4WR_04635 [Bulleidia sp.]